MAVVRALDLKMENRDSCSGGSSFNLEKAAFTCPKVTNFLEEQDVSILDKWGQ